MNNVIFTIFTRIGERCWMDEQCYFHYFHWGGGGGVMMDG